MIIHNVEQGSLEWLTCRLGIPTASNFHKIMTPKTRKISAQARKYAFLLIAEELLKRPMESLEGLEWIERGKQLEPDAVRLYEFENDIVTQPIGFITTNDGKIGASPDRLVGSDGMLEIKCPAPQTMISYAIDGLDDEYICQKQGQLYVGERQWTELFAYHPELPPIKLRIERDDDFINSLEKSLTEFNEMKSDMLEKVRARGFFTEPKKAMTVAESTYHDHLPELINHTNH